MNNTPNNPEYCLGCFNGPLCTVTNFVSDELAFVACDVALLCKMAVSFGSSHFCTCKGRILYYKKFRK